MITNLKQDIRATNQLREYRKNDHYGTNKKPRYRFPWWVAFMAGTLWEIEGNERHCKKPSKPRDTALGIEWAKMNLSEIGMEVNIFADLLRKASDQMLPTPRREYGKTLLGMAQISGLKYYKFSAEEWTEVGILGRPPYIFYFTDWKRAKAHLLVEFPEVKELFKLFGDRYK